MTETVTASVEILPINLIDPHPKNPRYVDRSERFSAIVESMKMYGFWPDKPIVVRPMGDRYQAIGGMTRLKAAAAAGIEQVYCCIMELSDDEAIVRMAEDNLGDPFSWAERCIYIAENAIRDSKRGLSRVRLVQACTGRTGNTAEDAAKRWGQSGELIKQMMTEQSVHLYGLLNSAKDLSRHLYEICALTDYADREYLVGRLIAETLTIEQIRSAVDMIRRSRIEPPAVAPIRDLPTQVYSPPRIAATPPSPSLSIVPVPMLQAVAEIKPRKSKPEYSPIDILTLELNAANDRVEKLERLIYGLFNTFGDKVPERYVADATRMGVFAFKFEELQNVG